MREGDLTSKMDGPSHVEVSRCILQSADKKHLSFTSEVRRVKRVVGGQRTWVYEHNE